MTRTAEQFHERMWDILDPVDTEYFEVVARARRAGDIQPGGRCRLPLPAAFAAFCQRANGLCVMAREEVWPHAKNSRSAPPGPSGAAWCCWASMRRNCLNGPASRRSAPAGRAGLPGILPVLKIVGDGSRIWGVDQAGTVVVIDDMTDPEPLEGDLTDLYAEQIAELMQRQQDMAQRLAERATASRASCRDKARRDAG